METARVHELGCGDGGNLVPMAFGLPRATFLGVDRNVAALARTQELAATLELTNMEFLAADLESFERPALTHALRDGAADTGVAHHLAASLARLADHALLVP